MPNDRGFRLENRIKQVVAGLNQLKISPDVAVPRFGKVNGVQITVKNFEMYKSNSAYMQFSDLRLAAKEYDKIHGTSLEKELRPLLLKLLHNFREYVIDEELKRVKYLEDRAKQKFEDDALTMKSKLGRREYFGSIEVITNLEDCSPFTTIYRTPETRILDPRGGEVTVPEFWESKRPHRFCKSAGQLLVLAKNLGYFAGVREDELKEAVRRKKGGDWTKEWFEYELDKLTNDRFGHAIRRFQFTDEHKIVVPQ